MIRAAIAKDLARLVADRGALASMVVLPLVFMITFGSIFDRGSLAGLGFQIAVPSNAALFGFFIALTVALAIVSERRTGTMQRHRAAPVARWRLLVAALLPYYVIGVGQLALVFGVGIAAFGMQVVGTWTALVAISLALTFCAVTLGLMLAAIAGSERQLAANGAVVPLVMGMLGGCMVPRIVMPESMQTLGLVVPHAWALDAYHDVLVRPGTTLSDVAPEIAMLFAFGAVFAAIGITRFGDQ